MVAASKAQRRRTFAVGGAIAAAGVVAASRQAAAGSEGFVAPQVSAKSLRAASGLQRSAGLRDFERFGGEEEAQPSWAAAFRTAAGAAAAAACLGVALLSPQEALARDGFTGSGAAVNKDPISLLQLAIPLEETIGEKPAEPVRILQRSIEEVKARTLTRLYDKVASSAKDADAQVTSGRKALLKPVSEKNRAAAEAIADKISAELQLAGKGIEKGMNSDAATEKDAEAAAAVTKSAIACQKLVGDLEELMVPPDYKPPTPSTDVGPGLPQLNGRAVVEVTLSRPEGSTERKYIVDSETIPEAKLKITVDGWSAPVSAGNFVDLVQRGFYNGMKVQRADGFIIQTGDSGPKDENGFRAENGKVRRIPLEIGLRGRKQALYGETMDEAKLIGRALPKIPFQADGAISMARTEFDNDSASSQFFLFLFESDMTPGGKNFMDGRYSSFGYTTEGLEFLRQVKEGDIIKSITVIDGADKLIKGA